LTGIEFIEDSHFILSEKNRVLSYNANNKKLEELFNFVGKYDNIQSIAYREETKELIFVNNGDVPVLVYVNQDGSTTELALDEKFNHYTINGLQLSGDYIFMGSTGYKTKDTSTSNSVIIQTELDGTFFKAWELDEKALSGVAILDKESPIFITTNLGNGGSFNTYESEALPSMANEQALEIEGSLELDIDQPSGVDYLANNDTFYFITDFGEVRSASIDGANEILFKIDAQQGSSEAIAVSLNDENIELHILNSDESLTSSQIQTYSLQGKRLKQFKLTPVQEEHLFESLDFNPVTGHYYLMNSNADSRKYLYTIDNDDTKIFELPSSYDDYHISGLDYSASNGYVYFVTQEFAGENGNNAGLMIIYDTVNTTEVDRYSIIDTTEPTLGVESPSGITLNNNKEPEIYITSDVNDSIFHIYSIEED